MYVIYARNVHEALPLMLHHLQMHGVRNESRYGNVVVAPTPVTTVYEKPHERVLFWGERDINPFFHLFEALWMLAGRNDVAWLAYYNKRMAEFSDDGETFHGAYGHRWRKHFLFDQLDTVVKLLTNKPNSRRAVIQMFDAHVDLREDETQKDIPCNTIITVWKHGNRLDMTVFCRSNDIIWGAAGTNAVHFAILQEYLAARIGLRPGELYQISNNFHAYEKVFEDTLPVARRYSRSRWQPYTRPQGNTYSPVPIVTYPNEFDEDLETFMAGQWLPSQTWTNPFFPEVAVPMHQAFQIFREGGDSIERFRAIQGILGNAAVDCAICKNPDWLHAAMQWMERREKKAIEAKEQ